MARLLMLSGNTASTSGSNVVHPRTDRQIRKFGVKKIICWNDNGTVGGAFSGLGNSDAMGTYGVLELHDTYDAPGGSSPTTSTSTLVMRIPVSGKSRLSIELPENGFVFKDGIIAKLGAEGSNNGGNKIYFQLVGYEYSV
tara:strand:+ start:557 stop:976 length:420 start_codon:yes stop_codon:yes gene_type:complete